MRIRTIKNLLRRSMRDIVLEGGGISQLIELVTATLNCITEATAPSLYRPYWAEVHAGILQRFGGKWYDVFLKEVKEDAVPHYVPQGTKATNAGAATPDQSEKTSARASEVTSERLLLASRHPQRIVRRVAASVGAILTAQCEIDFRRHSQQHHSCDRGFLFTPGDISEIKPIIKFLDILDKAEGMVLCEQAEAMLSGHNHNTVSGTASGTGGAEEKGEIDNAPPATSSHVSFQDGTGTGGGGGGGGGDGDNGGVPSSLPPPSGSGPVLGERDGTSSISLRARSRQRQTEVIRHRILEQAEFKLRRASQGAFHDPEVRLIIKGFI
jgi:hypothetical protein